MNISLITASSNDRAASSTFDQAEEFLERGMDGVMIGCTSFCF